MKKLYFLLFPLAISTIGFAQSDGHSKTSLEDGTAYHIEFKIRPELKEVDANGDGVLTIGSKDKVGSYAQSDHNKDGHVTPEEIAEGVPHRGAREVYRNLVYKRVSGETLLIDVYLPTKGDGGGYPLIYHTHGGGWGGGDKDSRGRRKTMFETFLTAGYAVASVHYRLVVRDDPENPNTMEHCVVDSKDGLRFLKKHESRFQLDMDRVVTFGGSAGGHLAMMLALTSPKKFEGDPLLKDYIVNPVGFITLFGPTSFMDPSLFLSGIDGARQLDGRRFAERMIKGAKATIYERAEEPLRGMMKKISPVTYLRKDSPPILSIHGDRDILIPKQHYAFLKESADKIGARVEVVIVKGAGHGFSGEGVSPTQPEIFEIMGRFAQQF